MTSRVLTERTVLRAGRIRRMSFFVRLFTFTELRDWLLAAGFTGIDGYGEDATSLATTSRRMVVTAQR